jgi:hypothetical protein
MNRFRRFTIGSLLLTAGLSAGVALAAPPRWPSLAEQLAKDRVPPGSALERLIAQNQDFRLLVPEEARDALSVPLWLRVAWRKAHPEIEMPKRNPAPSYPLYLKEAHEWMLSHPELTPPELDGLGQPPLQKVTVGTNLRISGAQTFLRAESDIRINPWIPSWIIAASNNFQTSGQQGVYWSTNAGSTWGQTLLSMVTGDAFHSDPTVDWNSTGTAWSTTLGVTSGFLSRLRIYRSTSSGSSWTFDSTASGSQSAVDKQMVWVDHGLMSPYVDKIYAIWHNGNPAYFNSRTATGAWGSVIQLSGAESSGSTIGSDVRTNSAGHVFAFWPTSGNRQIFVRKSTNGGASFTAAVSAATSYSNPGAVGIAVPAFANRRALTYVSGGAFRAPSVHGTIDNVYVSWTDLSGATGCNSPGQEPGTNVNSDCKTRIWFTRSTNGGATWETKRMINNQAGRNDQFNQWLTVDETNGTVAIIYYDTVDDSGRKKTHVYYQASLDHGATWSQPFRITSVQTDETVSGANSSFQYGDYNSLSGVARNFFPSWTDRRNNAREEIWTASLTEGGAPYCVADGGVDDTLYRQSCCSGVAVNGSTVCARASDYNGSWTTCNHVCGTALVNGCVPSGGVDDTLYSTDCCSGAAVPGSTWCLDPADYGTDWASCVQICQ